MTFNTTVDIAILGAVSKIAYLRRETDNWLRHHCRANFSKHWMLGEQLARFEFDDYREAVAFKLRVSQMLDSS